MPKKVLNRSGNAQSHDRIDLKILRAIESDGRISNVNLAEKVGLSPSRCWERLRRLETEGYIKRYTAQINQDLLGHSEIAIVEIVLERHDEAALDQMGSALASLPEVLEVHLTTGTYDYLLKVAVDGTRGYEAFLRDRLYKVKGIRQTRTSFILSCYKNRHCYIPAQIP